MHNGEIRHLILGKFSGASFLAKCSSLAFQLDLDGRIRSISRRLALTCGRRGKSLSIHAVPCLSKTFIISLSRYILHCRRLHYSVSSRAVVS